MADYTNSGVLFKNNKKQSEKQPDYTGKINIDGVEKALAGWKKTRENGEIFLSLRVSELQGQKQTTQQSDTGW